MPRTDGQILAAEPVSVTLGGKVYKITPQAHVKTRRFREMFSERGAVLGRVVHLVEGVFKDTQSVQFSEVVEVGLGFIGSDADALLDLVYEYSNELANDKDRIENSATDYELADALLACMKLVSSGPFGSLWGAIQSMTPGAQQK